MKTFAEYVINVYTRQIKWKFIRMAITFIPNIWNSNIHMMLSNYDYAPPPDQYI